MALEAGWAVVGGGRGTPPRTPAPGGGPASVGGMSRGEYSPPPPRARPLPLIPPTTVSSAKGAASGRYRSAGTRPFRKPKVGIGRPRWSYATGGADEETRRTHGP